MTLPPATWLSLSGMGFVAIFAAWKTRPIARLARRRDATTSAPNV